MADPFPSCRTEQEFERIRHDENRLRPVIHAIRESLGLADARCERFPEGSLPVYAIGDAAVLKVYPPLHADECAIESAALQAVEGRLPIPTPDVRRLGECEGWAYLLMGRLRGQCLATAWRSIPDGARVRLASILGESLKTLHTLAIPDVLEARFDWQPFLEGQRETAVDRQRVRGLDEAWLAQIEAFLERTPLPASDSRCLLHTEIMREHLMVECVDDEWWPSGLLDFEPAMGGAREYEFASVGLFFSCGDYRLLRRLLLSYGYRASELDLDLEQRLLAYALLHRYSNLPWFLSRLPAGRDISTLDGLARWWWRVVS